ncbi:unnamed protein product [Sphenostylis stenocarpa]|uniref:Uncharacterized protein n=1 Tax=Sphenostylis stenocarpa TaxID=92480 RepID=A0AA86S9K5_9FABA|nr:unnamed protein product [Sphenostylis stenocarpa]
MPATALHQTSWQNVRWRSDVRIGERSSGHLRFVGVVCLRFLCRRSGRWRRGGGDSEGRAATMSQREKWVECVFEDREMENDE